ncbi:putative Tannase [Seiridium unicorne]|uniref:Carboxylic ester hydrolase n=1 Tax=Seiridium unicorne TaxID=138068 RepID=A0ABR2ULM9_9PEZI
MTKQTKAAGVRTEKPLAERWSELSATASSVNNDTIAACGLLDGKQHGVVGLEDIRDYGGKIIRYHGKSNNSIPASSSVIYQDIVRQPMYPDLSVTDGYAQLIEFYRFYLVPGAGHCGRNQSQPNGPFPSAIIGSVIDWGENGNAPDQLPAVTTSGVSEGFCLWSTRPLWSECSDEKECVLDQESYEPWLPKPKSVPVPVW